MRPLAAVAFVALTTVVLAGCGGGGGSKKTAASTSTDRAQITQLVSDLTTASQVGDGNRICNRIFSPGLAQTVTRAAKKPCPQVVSKRLFSPRASFRVDTVSVSGAQASARVTDQAGRVSIFSFAKESGQWRLVGVSPAT